MQQQGQNDPSNTTKDSAGADHHLKNFVFKDIEELAKSVIDYQGKRTGKEKERIIEFRGKLAGFANSYLKKMEGLLPKETADSIENRIRLLEGSDPENTIVLMTAHQPNLFAYSGVLRKIALLKAMERRISKDNTPRQIICFYGVADADFVHNKWVRSAEMPAPLRKDGVLRFSININKKDLYLPTNKIEKPATEKLESWKSQISSWISEDCSLAIKYAKKYNMQVSQANIIEMAKNNFDGYWDYVVKAHGAATNLAEFSSFTLATIVNTVFETPVVFANFSDCFTAFGNEYQFLLANAKEYSDIIERNEKTLKSLSIESGLTSDVSELLPIWIKCQCGSKYRMSSIASSPGKFEGECMRCENRVKYSTEDLMVLLNSSPQLFEPRSISMALAFARALDMSCYIGGSGGLGYLMHTRAVSERFGLPLPPTPYWSAHDDYIGIETLAAAWETQRVSQTYGLLETNGSIDSVVKDVQAASAELNGKFEKGLVQKNAVSERERQLLENIHASLKVPACSLDYAINIGMGSTYKQWVDFLANGGNLQDNVGLRSIIK